jgi:hypothetical protein
MANCAYNLGHCALVITDHDYAKGSYPANHAELRTLKETNSLPTIPIIIGAEIKTPLGEYLLFGSRAIRNWNQHYSKLKATYELFGELSTWIHAFRTYVLNVATLRVHSTEGRRLYKIEELHLSNYALIKCHPTDFSAEEFGFIPKEWWNLVHGFELQNNLNYYDRSVPDIVATLRNLIPGGIEMRNSDAHCTDDMEACYNECNIAIKDEHQLIQWIKLSKKKYLEKQAGVPHGKSNL